MANIFFKDYVAGLSQGTLTDDSEQYNLTGGVSLKNDISDIFDQVNADNTVLVRSLADLPSAVANVRTLMINTVYEIGAPLNDGINTWALPSTCKIFSQSSVNSITTAAILPFLTSSGYDSLVLDGLTIISTGGAGSQLTDCTANSNFDSRFVINDCSFKTFQVGVDTTNAFVKINNTEITDSTNHIIGFNSVYLLSEVITSNAVAIGGSVHITIGADDPNAITGLRMNGGSTFARVNETGYDVSQGISGTFTAIGTIFGFIPAPGTPFFPGSSGLITKIEDNGGFAKYTTSSSHGLSIGDFVFIEGDCSTFGSQKLTLSSGTAFTTDRVFVDTQEENVTYTTGSVNQRNPNALFSGNLNMADSRVYAVNRLPATTFTNIATIGVYQTIAGPWSGQTVGAVTDTIMARCETSGDITYLGPNETNCRVTLRGSTQVVGNDIDDVGGAIFLNGVLLEGSESPLMGSGGDSGYVTSYELMLNTGDVLRAATANHDSTANSVINEQYTALILSSV